MISSSIFKASLFFVVLISLSANSYAESQNSDPDSKHSSNGSYGGGNGGSGANGAGGNVGGGNRVGMSDRAQSAAYSTSQPGSLANQTGHSNNYGANANNGRSYETIATHTSDTRAFGLGVSLSLFEKDLKKPKTKSDPKPKGTKNPNGPKRPAAPPPDIGSGVGIGGIM